MFSFNRSQKSLFDLGIPFEKLDTVIFTVSDSRSETLSRLCKNRTYWPGKYVAFKHQEYSKYPTFMFLDYEEMSCLVTLVFLKKSRHEIECKFSPYFWNVNSITKIIDSFTVESTDHFINCQNTLLDSERSQNFKNHEPPEFGYVSPKKYKDPSVENTTVSFDICDPVNTATIILLEYLEKTMVIPGKVLFTMDTAKDSSRVIGKSEYTVSTECDLADIVCLYGLEVIADRAVFGQSIHNSNCIQLTVCRQSDVIVGMTDTDFSVKPGLEVHLLPMGKRSSVCLTYNPLYFNDAEIKRHSSALKAYLVTLADVDTLAKKTPPPTDLKLREELERSLFLNADNLAIETFNKSYTYSELARSAAVIASTLSDCQSLVCIISKPTFEFIATVLACISKNICYLPIDPRVGLLKISDILAESKPQTVICDESSSRLLQGNEIAHLTFDKLFSKVDRCTRHKLYFTDRDDSHENTIFRTYTSEQYGKPKAWDINEVNVGALFESYQAIDCGIYKRTWPFTSSIGSNSALKQYLGPLLYGGSVYIPESTIIDDPVAVVSELNRRNIGVLNTSPAVLSRLVNSQVDLKGYDTVFIEGEAVSQDLISRFYELSKPVAVLINLYGQTETSLTTAYYRVPRNVDHVVVPIGNSLLHSKAHILNESFGETLVGEKGHLSIAGAIVANGQKDGAEVRFANVMGATLYNTNNACLRWFDDLLYVFDGNESQVAVDSKIMLLNDHGAVQWPPDFLAIA